MVARRSRNRSESVRPGAIPNQPFEPLTVGGLDMNASIQTDPSAVLPSEHVLGVVGLQEAVADHVAEDPFPDCVLEALQDLTGEGGSFVEAEFVGLGGGVLVRFPLNPLEEAVYPEDLGRRTICANPAFFQEEELRGVTGR